MYLVKRGQFPQPIPKMTPGSPSEAVRFVEDEIDAHVDAQIAKRDAKLAEAEPEAAEATA